MPPRLGRSPGRPLARAAGLFGLAACVLVGTAVGVQAEDGLGGFLQRLFSPAPAPAAPAWNVDGARPLATASDRRVSLRHRRARYAALPRAEPLPIHIGQRQTPLDMKDGAAAAFLKDETLRPGDIVVLPEGAQVFTGVRGERHHKRDFAPASGSTRLDRKTRALLVAMVRPQDTTPAGPIARPIARPLAGTPPVRDAVATEASLVRVVSPWRTTP